MVFDAAAKYRGTSLNDNLVQGPDLVNSLVGVLVRFRQEPVALVGDIEAMFHQVKVSNPDRDALRFLWWKHGNLDGPVEVYRMNSHVFGAKSSPSCAAYALKKTATDQQGNYGPDVIKAVNRNFYVDDLLTSTATATKAINLVTGLKSLLHTGGFKLTKWASNSRDVVAAVPEAERAPALISLDLDDDLPNDRALGVYWDIEEDCFTFKTKEDDKQLTRRGILSMVASLFDPLGLVAPTVLDAKRLLQKLCRDNYGWDDPITPLDVASWIQWRKEYMYLAEIKIPRCFKPQECKVKDVELHVFSDASSYGYGCCAYVRIRSSDDSVHTALVMGKSRLAPIKAITIPRLELTAAVAACRLMETTCSSTSLTLHSCGLKQRGIFSSARYMYSLRHCIHEATSNGVIGSSQP